MKWDEVWKQPRAKLMGDYVEVAVDRHVHKAGKLWQWRNVRAVSPLIVEHFVKHSAMFGVESMFCLVKTTPTEK